MSIAVSKKYDFSALNVNARNIHEIGTEKTGLRLLELISEEFCIEDWSEIKLLDIGCGVRFTQTILCLLYTSPSPRDGLLSRMPSSA